MKIETTQIVMAVLIGTGATLIMDIWAVFLLRVFNIPSLNFCLVGRWLGHMLAGKFKHEKITLSSKRPAECVLGWSAHYLIGVLFALIMLGVVSNNWLVNPDLLPALLTGIVTLVIPFFIMQPAMGLGIAAAKTPHPWQARLKSTMTHVIFGCGLYLSACVIGYIQPIII
jgi:hypothetical protein